MLKLLPSAVASLAIFASIGAASAESAPELDRARSTAASLALANVRADRAGTAEVYPYEDGNIGQFPGSASVQAGTTTGLDTALSRPMDGRVLAVLMNSHGSIAKLETRLALANQGRCLTPTSETPVQSSASP